VLLYIEQNTLETEMKSVVYLLVMLTYNQVSHTVVDTTEVSWHISNSACLTAKADESAHGRSPGYNREYFCMPVQDAEMRNRLKAGQYDRTYPRTKNGGGTLLLEWN
jgi:hypothetical protein